MIMCVCYVLHKGHLSGQEWVVKEISFHTQPIVNLCFLIINDQHVKMSYLVWYVCLYLISDSTYMRWLMVWMIVARLLLSLRREFGSCSALSTLKRLRNLISPPLRDLLLFFCRPSLFHLTERQWRPSLPFPLLSSISLSALCLPLSSPGLQSGNAFLPLAVPPCVRKAQSHTKTQLFPNS